MSDHEAVVCMAFDAFRLCLGKRPKNFTRTDVVRWLRYLGDNGIDQNRALNQAKEKTKP